MEDTEVKIDEVKNDILADIPTEGEPFGETDEKETETPAASPVENKPEAAAPPSEGVNTPDEDNLPFHKHPRWKEMHERNKRLESELNEFKTFRESATRDLESVKSAKDAKSEEVIPERAKRLFGENPEAYRLWKEEMEDWKTQAKREVYEDQQRVQAESQARLSQANSWIDQSLNTLREEGKEFDKNELFKVAKEFMPTDENGNLDLRRAYNIMERMKASEISKVTAAKKEVARNATPTPVADPPSKQFLTNKDLAHKDFRDLI